jgi:RNA polymerase sigma-70 factor (family 1)
MHLDQSENWNDLNLLQLLQQGDASAFTNLYYHHSHALYRKIVWRVNDEDIAKELLQDLFLKLWENREKIDLTKSFRSYLYTIAVNLVYDYFRKSSRRKELESHLMAMAIDYYSHVEEAIISKENVALINDAINQLPPQRKQVFMLCRLEGKSYEEVGEILNISRSTIHDHIVKANHLIKDYLSKHPDIALCLLLCSFFSS